MEADRLRTATLNDAPWGDKVIKILAAALGAVDPRRAVQKALQADGKHLLVEERSYHLKNYGHIYVIGAGKAGAPMALAVEETLGNRVQKGVVIVKDGHALSGPAATQLSKIEIVEASHPIPDRRGVAATERILKLLGQAQENDLVLCLISGGGSALLTAPAPGVSLADLQSLTDNLLASGASIDEINILRKHLDRVKGGGLAKQAAPASLISLILSDVVGNPLDVIASGPTVPDPSTFRQAYDILEKYELLERTPRAILEHLQRGLDGEIPETPKEDNRLFELTHNVLVGSNWQAAQAALQQARREGFNTLLLTTYLQGEASQAGRMLGAILRQADVSGEPLPRPLCIIAGGETTVTLRGDGLGGRNQEMALAAVKDLAGIPEIALVTLATDGGDGPSDAAGAIVTGETFERGLKLGLDPEKYLNRNDSYHYFDSLGDLLKPGPTQTNVNDLAFLFAF